MAKINAPKSPTFSPSKGKLPPKPPLNAGVIYREEGTGGGRMKPGVNRGVIHKAGPPPKWEDPGKLPPKRRADEQFQPQSRGRADEQFGETVKSGRKKK